MAVANPYQAPQARVADVDSNLGGMVLANRSTRLAAVLLDGLIFAGFGIIAAIILPMYANQGLSTGAASVVFTITGVVAVVVVIANLILLHRHGQTIGKRILKIKIVRTTGERAGLARILILRWLVLALLGSIRYLGFVIFITDSLLIFRDSRKCLHDNIADTIVIKA